MDGQFLLDILTIEQWRAFGLLVLVVAAIVETAKRVVLSTVPAARRKRLVYAIAFVTGIGASLAGWQMVGTEAVSAFLWLAFGIVAGPASNLLHWAVLGVIAWRAPALADALKGKRGERASR